MIISFVKSKIIDTTPPQKPKDFKVIFLNDREIIKFTWQIVEPQKDVKSIIFYKNDIPFKEIYVDDGNSYTMKFDDNILGKWYIQLKDIRDLLSEYSNIIYIFKHKDNYVAKSKIDSNNNYVYRTNITRINNKFKFEPYNNSKKDKFLRIRISANNAQTKTLLLKVIPK